ncbi:hypothetical protein [uncultured Arthrobacter sp.]|uniref:hypothetical protein n=1 Tax=uncultured Arthrobacter sp. TaxID=114050 RepID=UPI0026211279|nr:hypothetical protein [uncultured Arthrobacter sp.]
MADYKVIMTLAIAGHSYDEIVAAARCSRREVASVKKTIAAYGFTAGQVSSMTPAEIAGLFPDGRKQVSERLRAAEFRSCAGGDESEPALHRPAGVG